MPYGFQSRPISPKLNWGARRIGPTHQVFVGQAGLGVGGLPPTSGAEPRASHRKSALHIFDLTALIGWRKKIPTLPRVFLFGKRRMHFRQVLPCEVAGEGKNVIMGSRKRRNRWPR